MPALSSFGGLSAIGRGSRSGGRKLVQITLSSSINNYVLDTAKAAAYEPGNTDVVLTIDSGVVVGSLSSGSYSLTVDTSWSSLDTVTVINNGSVLGAQNSGPAMYVQRALSVTNNNVIGGGGGAGGTGQSASSPDYGDPPCSCGSAIGGAAGGAGGAGAGSGGAAGAGSAGAQVWSCTGYCEAVGGTGGTGGSYGSFGATGGNASSSTCGVCSPAGPYGGSAGGSCTSGNANITWLATGTRYGALN